MKLVGIPISVILILSAAVIIVLKHLLSSIFQNQIQLTSRPLFLFSLPNTILFSIMVGSYRQCICQADEVLHFGCPHELEEGIHDNIEGHSDEDDNNDDDCHGSDGYDEDDNGSDYEVGWEDEEEGCDDNLQKRIEDFIAKVNNAWKEEKFGDKLNPS